MTLASQRFSEFELHARAILGLPVDGLRACQAHQRSFTEGSTARASPLPGLLTRCVPGTDLRLFGKAGELQKRRMENVVATGATTEEARGNVQNFAANKVKPIEPKAQTA